MLLVTSRHLTPLSEQDFREPLTSLPLTFRASMSLWYSPSQYLGRMEKMEFSVTWLPNCWSNQSDSRSLALSSSAFGRKKDVFRDESRLDFLQRLPFRTQECLLPSWLLFLILRYSYSFSFFQFCVHYMLETSSTWWTILMWMSPPYKPLENVHSNWLGQLWSHKRLEIRFFILMPCCKMTGNINDHLNINNSTLNISF